MTEREEFEAWALRDGGYSQKDLEVVFGQYVDEHANTALDAWQASRRTTPDREAIINECIVAISGERLEDEPDCPEDEAYNVAVGDCADALERLKTAPNGEKG
ncbi:hypothetical protein [Burkholderia lata]|uniref:Uncharacterized protein n=1 Tax=Burkholderia lata (strain ATCC 17760 / DSM 23089 / LMG 22485 / NCIMB 9086 / R18194 / 383) TaxID=482957 RepID=A0A6P2GVG3_BURL3|nr:hypothetical protein [Burkholderia lata]VWB08492.1 hypothetical protein BLA6863_00220 [Burkholderia lata]